MTRCLEIDTQLSYGTIARILSHFTVRQNTKAIILVHQVITAKRL